MRAAVQAELIQVGLVATLNLREGEPEHSADGLR